MVPHEGRTRQKREAAERQTGFDEAGAQAQETAMSKEYVHQRLNSETSAPAGHYTLHKELRLEVRGGEVLCVTGVGILERSCCEGLYITAGSGGPYALVPGYIISWHCRVSETGMPVSEVEPVHEQSARREVAAMIDRSEGIRNIEFWQ
jgi:hypothetical protein